MSNADFAAELEQSVQTHLDAILVEAEAAKGRIFARVAMARPLPPQPAPSAPSSRAAVSFDDPFDAALSGAAAPVNVFKEVDAPAPGA
jgi:hypothetical protein